MIRIDRDASWRAFVLTGLLTLLGSCGGGGAVPEPAPPVEPPEPSLVRFQDVTSSSGIASLHTGVLGRSKYFVTGQAFGDYDGDGWLDLYLTDSGGPNTLYRNTGDGTFDVSPWNDTVALPAAVSGGTLFVDYDNDGDKDLFVCNYGANTLFRNTGTAFEDVAVVAGVAGMGKSESACWGDFDGDGWLDLYVANWYCDDCGLADDVEGSRDRLYRARGDGTFEDVSAYLGIEYTTGFGLVAAWLDYDNDGDLDLYLCNDKGVEGPDEANIRRNVLWRNDGAGPGGTWLFTELARDVNADQARDAMGIAIGDIDNDGWLDMAFTHTGPSVLLRNTGTAWDDISAAAGIDEWMVGWGITFQDWDRDGWLDMYIAANGTPNKLWLNERDNTFRDVSSTSGADQPGTSYGVASADYDRDGHLDLVVGNFNEGYRLFRCIEATGEAAGRHWIRVRLTGAAPINRDAVGARVTIRRADGLVQMQEVKCGASLGAGCDLALQFGLGDSSVQSLEVRWPDGTVTQHDDVQIDQEVAITYSSP